MKKIQVKPCDVGSLRQGHIQLFTHYGKEDKQKVVTLPGRQYRKNPEPHWIAPATPEVWHKVKKRWPKAAQRAAETRELCRELEDRLSFRQRAHEVIEGIEESIASGHPPLDLYEWHTEPRTHQISPTVFARDVDSCLLDCWMGAGKTKMALDAVANRRDDTVLVICPCSVIDVWQDELEKHLPDYFENVLPLRDRPVEERAEILKRYSRQGEKPLLAIINYDVIWWECMEPAILDYLWDTVIFDESHRIKSAGANCSWTAKKIPAVHMIGLTGTPLPHSPLDAYGQYRALDIGIFGSRYKKFQSRYAEMGGYEGRQVLDYVNTDQLRRRMDKIRVSVSEDALDMPEKQVIDRTCKLEGRGKRIYDQLDNCLMAKVKEGEVTAANALAKLLRLQQIASGFVPVEKEDPDLEDFDITTLLDPEKEPDVKEELVEVSTAKRQLLTELLEDLYPERAVIFARFRQDLDSIHESADHIGYDSMEISGRQRDYREWKEGNRHDGTVIAVQIQAGSLGIDLTEARYGIVYTTGFSLGNYEQALARLHRPAQDSHAITIYRLIAQGTVDRKIVRAIDWRRDLIEEILSEWRDM